MYTFREKIFPSVWKTIESINKKYNISVKGTTSAILNEIYNIIPSNSHLEFQNFLSLKNLIEFQGFASLEKYV